VLLSLFLQLPLLPDTLELSGLTAFLVNVKLMAKLGGENAGGQRRDPQSAAENRPGGTWRGTLK